MRRSSAGRLTCLLQLLAATIWILTGSARAADPQFDRFIQSLWPEAERLGISRATFERETRALEPDLSLPDLVIPGKPAAPSQGQAEFVRPPADYMSEGALARLTAQGQRFLQDHRSTLTEIERRFGVPGPVVLAIWGRETNYGAAKLPHDTIRVLATQAYLGRRKDMFRGEFLLALKMLQEGHVTRSGMRASWAGAMGLTQFLPTDFYRYAVDFDGDGTRNIWRSVPDALASAARQLSEKGWQAGRRWGFEVRLPKDVDCTIAEPDTRQSVAQWIKQGYAPLSHKPLPAELAEEASLFLPAVPYGPAFLTLKNFYVLKGYNFADLYALFVGHLADRIAGGESFRTRWAPLAQLRSDQLEAIQRQLTQDGYYRDKIDGKAGMKTRSALGAYQKAAGLKLDCWPSAAVLEQMRLR